MKRKYLAFDIETSKDVPGEEFDWKPQPPAGHCLCRGAAERRAGTVSLARENGRGHARR